ncbi:MAG: PilT/PilU family type 4a pilus ATPase, partial [Chitinivibrionales bacterium]|nr:PilT/PilU family type 4a pilus ATPase [Chitinivibrionales bacterium]MBD3395726.1 PilT/PilU family type 4a pilus ATPase [Chitinivibrionales bacterium]
MSYKYSMRQLLSTMVEHNATDLLFSVGQPPQMRIDKNLYPLGEEVLSPEDTRQLCYQVMNEHQQKRLEDEWEVDFSIGIPNLCRFRVNVFVQRSSVSAAFRRIPYSMYTFDELSLPPVVVEMSDKPNGLVLVTGPTGSGKSTTLAAMLDRINETRHAHMITIEDPIEYLHSHKNCTIEQREVGTDTKSFHNALRSILRQDPDIVLLGEMRDVESIQAALTIAETGHLCFTTLHTNSCAQTLSRIVDVFPGDKQQQIRTQLAMTLNCVMSQTLLPRMGGGLQLSMEIMVATPAVRSLVRENKIHNIDNQIALGAKFGMQTMNQSLSRLVKG